jgi:hypothetical protein
LPFYTSALEYKWHDGRIYRGEWRDGKAHGLGIETQSSGQIYHQGFWIDDKPVTGP